MLIAKGAEAEIYITTWFNKKAILKWRLPKRYRDEYIDRYLREYRTKNEARLISASRRCGIPTPIIYDIDKDNCSLTMEYINGKKVKDILDRYSKTKRKKICKKIGEIVGIMHTNNLIHGDLTTANMIEKDDRIYFIDFGLGEVSAEIEKKGVDLHVLWECFKSAHIDVIENFDDILTGYREYESESVISKMHEISERGRYA